MIKHGPIFEQSQSPLYRSNDGELEIETGYVDNEGGGVVTVVTHRGELVLSTHLRTLADAYVAGWDQAKDASPGELAEPELEELRDLLAWGLDATANAAINAPEEHTRQAYASRLPAIAALVARFGAELDTPRRKALARGLERARGYESRSS